MFKEIDNQRSHQDLIFHQALHKHPQLFGLLRSHRHFIPSMKTRVLFIYLCHKKSPKTFSSYPFQQTAANNNLTSFTFSKFKGNSTSTARFYLLCPIFFTYNLISIYEIIGEGSPIQSHRHLVDQRYFSIIIIINHDHPFLA